MTFLYQFFVVQTFMFTVLWGLNNKSYSDAICFLKKNQPSQGGDDVPRLPLWPPAEQLPASSGGPEVPGQVLPEPRRPASYPGESSPPLHHFHPRCSPWRSRARLCSSLVSSTPRLRKWSLLLRRQRARWRGQPGRWHHRIHRVICRQRVLTRCSSVRGENCCSALLCPSELITSTYQVRKLYFIISLQISQDWNILS